MKILSREQVLKLHTQLIQATGGTDGVRDTGLLESALAAPFQEFGDCAAYPSLLQKAARLGFGIMKNHPFLDGNKRIGVHAMLVLLELNGIRLQYTQTELSDAVWRLAAGEDGYAKLLKWLLEHEV